ncbi:MAG: hypothetical protein FWH53_03315 [Leptospirales bacterium]|nr:hypothetical protein [Leptospirales bacterium]
MNRKLKQILKNQTDIVKKMFPEVYIEVKMYGYETFICIDSLEISNKEEYKSLIVSFIKENDSNGFLEVFWGVNSSLTKDDLMLLEKNKKNPPLKGAKAAPRSKKLMVNSRVNT